MSIRLRLTLWYSALLAATLLVLGVSLYAFINWNTYATLKDQIKKQSDGIGISASYIINWSDRSRSLDLNLDRQSRIEYKDMYVQLINYYSEGQSKQSDNLRLLNTYIPYPEAEEKPQRGFVEHQMTIGNQKYKIITYQTPLVTQNNELVGLLQVGAIPLNEDRLLASLRNTLIFSFLIVLLIAFSVGMLLARQALRPIGQVIHATQQIEKGSDLSVRIPAVGPKDEIGTLVDTLNKMLARLEKAYNELDEAYKAQRRFVSDASHELRTPLTTIRGNIDLLEKMWLKADQNGGAAATGREVVLDNEHWQMSSEAMSDIAAEAVRMSNLVGDLLALARADAGYEMPKSSIEALPLTEEVVRKAQLLPRTASWRIGDLTALEDAAVYGNHEYLQQLLFIFIENAFKYTPSGYVELSAVRKDDHVGWVIQDTGIGMNPEQIPHIFDRFYRADESRGVTSGTGLGLSIAKWILDEHGGSVEAVTRIDEGTTFTIWLPLHFPLAPHSSIIEDIE